MEASLIIPRLYVGSAPNPFSGPTPYTPPVPVNTIILCAAEYQPHPDHFGPPGKRPVRNIYLNGFNDEWYDEIPPEAWATSTRASFHLRRGDSVALTCIQGRNRSALVAALVLYKLGDMRGREARRIVQQRRQAPRGDTLSNKSFVMLLDELP